MTRFPLLEFLNCSMRVILGEYFLFYSAPRLFILCRKEGRWWILLFLSFRRRFCRIDPNSMFSVFYLSVCSMFSFCLCVFFLILFLFLSFCVMLSLRECWNAHLKAFVLEGADSSLERFPLFRSLPLVLVLMFCLLSLSSLDRQSTWSEATPCNTAYNITRTRDSLRHSTEDREMFKARTLVVGFG